MTEQQKKALIDTIKAYTDEISNQLHCAPHFESLLTKFAETHGCLIKDFKYIEPNTASFTLVVPDNSSVIIQYCDA